MRQRIMAVLLILLMLVGPLRTTAAGQSDPRQLISELLTYCAHHGAAAETDVLRLLEELEKVDPWQGRIWRDLLENWGSIYRNTDTVPKDITPGLPTDDSLCLVIMGYDLNDDGSMQPELIRRLEAGLAAAQTYPQAWILCTGGETSYVPGVSEAGEMKKWLTAQGIAPERILTEEESLSTTENAVYSFQVLRFYPQIIGLAVITSGYHLPRSVLMFDSAGIYNRAYRDGPELRVIGTAACDAEGFSSESIYQQSWGLAILAGIQLEQRIPELSLPEDLLVEEGPEELRISAVYENGYIRDVTERASVSAVDGDKIIRYSENGKTVEKVFPEAVSEELPQLQLPPAETDRGLSAQKRVAVFLGCCTASAAGLLYWFIKKRKVSG